MSRLEPAQFIEELVDLLNAHDGMFSYQAQRYKLWENNHLHYEFKSFTYTTSLDYFSHSLLTFRTN